MKNKIEEWKYRPAKWYQFWRPQSGTTGGLIFGSLIMIVLILIMETLT